MGRGGWGGTNPAGQVVVDLVLPLLPVVGANMGIQAVPSLEVFLTKGTWIARCFNMCFNVFLHVLLGVVAVAADVTDKCALGNPPDQSLDFLINLPMVCTPSCKVTP